ncbi:Transmembrane osmosensor, variant 4 [Entomophthora muscae]|uniref:Transmembrane osmosensor, variant 4 n=2 Tax=Entomophthora muscae TaxID=34485 RepID=A0ACC2T982_9FUNG|nr:Transmembrane osmosensor, variant 4 [Entomophthora muscae]
MSTIRQLSFSDAVWLLSTFLSGTGWLFVTAGAAGLALPTFIWMYILFTLMTILMVIYVVRTRQFPAYRLQLVFMLSVVIMLLGTTIRVVENQNTNFLTLIFIGAVVQIVVMLFWILLIGSEPGTLAYYLSGQSDALVGAFIPQVGGPYGATTAGDLYFGVNPASTSTHLRHHISGITAPDHVLRVRAHYPYEATSPEEVSFVKHEVMEVLNNQGNWWKVLKADGRIGMAPSNYVTTPLLF